MQINVERQGQGVSVALSPVSSSSYHVVTEAQVTRQAAQHRGHTVTVVKQATR